MNIISAIKSGKPFRRTGRDWMTPLDQGTHNWLTLPEGDLIADDWETKEPREFWIVESLDEIEVCYTLKAAALYSKGKIIHVREIL